MQETGNGIEHAKNEDERDWEINSYENDKGKWHVYPGLCKGCGLCIEKCPVRVIEWAKELGFSGTPTVKPRVEGCIVCGICQTVCPDAAIHIEKKGKEVPPAAVPVH
ncbi:MAG: 4Fe-4S dicluster domain-containing protein [Eubacteriales bacterium]